MARVGWVTAQFDSALLLYNTPIGRGIDLTNWYKYQRRMSFTTSTLMMETEEISETLVFSSTLTRLIAREGCVTFIRCESIKSYVKEYEKKNYNCSQFLQIVCPERFLRTTTYREEEKEEIHLRKDQVV
jgi:hypothetical protein